MIMSAPVSAAEKVAPPKSPARYDNFTIGLHWTIVLLIAAQWLGAELIDYVPGKPAHQLYWSIHISIGVVFAATVITHLWWRMTGARKLPNSNEEAWQMATRVMQATLSWLPLLLALLGIGIVLARGWTLFGVITIPMMPGGSRPLARQIHGIHEWTAHVVVFLAVGHASAALFHHYVLRDGLIGRMFLAPRK
jgi:cytochrome b561